MNYGAAAMRFPWPPAICLATIVAGVVAGVFYPLPWIGEPLSDILFAVGWLLIAGTVAIDLAAMRAMSRAKTTILPHRPATHLVTDGPFGFTRNPIYLGYAMVLIGIGLVMGNLWFLPLTVLAAYLIAILAIGPEEKHLAARFGKRYRDYAARVRRWI